MFSGIIQSLGNVAAVQTGDGNTQVRIDAEPSLLKELSVGASVAVAGVCLTVTEYDAAGFSVDISDETLASTTFKDLEAGVSVNLEPALKVGQALDGHLVSGHVDGVSTVAEVTPRGQSLWLKVEPPVDCMRYIAHKGSVCLDGVSLTINQVNHPYFEVNLIPHTQSVTTLRDLQAGDKLNTEVDLIARYTDRLLAMSDN